MLQIDYDQADYTKLKTNFNLSMINMANIQTQFIKNIPSELTKISEMTDRISNLNIISGNCYLYKKGMDLKVISNDGVIFNAETNTFKLEPALSYVIEIKGNSSKLISNKQYRIYDKEKTKLKNLDDLLIRKESISITTTENNYDYIFNLNFSSMVSLNNLTLKLNKETESYPNIAEIYYINNKKEKIILKILNNDDFNINLDIYRNEKNIHSIDIETINSDNLFIRFEDNLQNLIIDELTINYMEYKDKGSIVLECLKEDKPVLKVGLQATGDLEHIEYQISYNQIEWYSIDISNVYGLEKTNKVLAFNTISKTSIKDTNDVKNIFIRLILNAKKYTFTPIPDIDKEIYRNNTFNTTNIKYDNYSLYESNNAVYYGKKSVANTFNFEDLYEEGEYLKINNKYYVKGFIETLVSKTKESGYTYSPVELKSKEIKKENEVIEFPSIDISTKELYAYRIDNIIKNLLSSEDLDFVLPLKDNTIKSKYYIFQNDKEIEINLNLGYINSTLEVLVIIDPRYKVYLLNSFKNNLEELTPKTLEIGEDLIIHYISLLDSSLFEENNYSRTYPLTQLNQYELGLIDNTINSINLDQEIPLYTLKKYKLYTEDKLSNTNINYTKIISTEDYNRTIRDKNEIIGERSKVVKLMNNSLVKGSVIIKEVE